MGDVRRARASDHSFQAPWFGQAEFIFNCPEDLAADLRIGMGVAGDHHDISVDITGEREARHTRWCPEQQRVFALLKVKIGNQGDPGQVDFLGLCRRPCSPTVTLPYYNISNLPPEDCSVEQVGTDAQGSDNSRSDYIGQQRRFRHAVASIDAKIFLAGRLAGRHPIWRQSFPVPHPIISSSLTLCQDTFGHPAAVRHR